MGLDLYLKINPCKTCGHAEFQNNFSITYNVSPMWYKIFPDHPCMLPIEGITGAQAYDILVIARGELDMNPKEFIALNPVNDYGSYEEFHILINNLITKCIQYPNAVWEAWR